VYNANFGDIMKLSKTSKLGTKSWSLQAVETCPGAVGADGKLVPACSGCYATAGCYNFPDTKKVRADNKVEWDTEGFEADFIAALKKQTHFRWFDSGDMYNLRLAEKMYNIMVNTPNTKHWLPTRMYKFEKFQNILNKMQALPNVMVRYSSDEIDGTYTKGLHGSTILPDESYADSDTVVCKAPEQGGKCLDCRACYNKDISVIGYLAHGAKMKKVIRIAQI
jgi:hypothetical protein